MCGEYIDYYAPLNKQLNDPATYMPVVNAILEEYESAKALLQTASMDEYRSVLDDFCNKSDTRAGELLVPKVGVIAKLKNFLWG